MTRTRILSRIACAAALVLALTAPSIAGKWTLVDNILTYVDDVADGARKLDGGINDAANAGRKLDDAGGELGSVGRAADEAAGEAGDAGALLAREAPAYDRILPDEFLDDAAYAAAEAQKKIPNIVRQGDKVGGAPLSILDDGYVGLPIFKNPGGAKKLLSPAQQAIADRIAKGPPVNLVAKSAYEAADSPLGDANTLRKVAAVDQNKLPDLSTTTLKLAKSLPDLPPLQKLGKAAGDGASNLPKAARAAGSDPATNVAAARNGTGWSTRKKVILATGVTTGLLVTGGAAAAALAYSTYEPAKEVLDDVADKTADLAKQPVILTVNNYTEDRVEIFEVLFNTRKSLATIETSGDFASISAKVGDRIEITRNGESFTTIVLQQDELVYIQ